MYRIFLSLITIICVITEGHLMSIPVFGTKRYHRTPSLSGSVATSNLPYYNQLSTYYDSQPMSASLSTYDTIPIASNLNTINNNNNNNNINNNFQNGYLTENGYYYYPHHQYHSYGMPTYQGDYKPKPYYYAPAPRYSYYDDRDIISNPMDDLHEEILHEDERERQLELQPTLYGQESWYQTHNNHQQQDELTNNFLKNLIEYNRQIDAQQKLQQQQEDELMQRDQEHKLQLQYQQQLEQEQQQQSQQQQQQQPFGDEYDEYVELGDYEYEPQPSENINDMKKYERLDNLQPSYQQQQQARDVYNPQQQQQQMKTVSKHFENNDDEDVRQLKSLAHHANVQNLKPSDTKSSKSHHKMYNVKDDDSTEETDTNNFSQNNWNQPQNEQPTSRKSYAQYDNEPEEYDDDAWISWDRKRSPPDTVKNLEKWKQSLKKIEAIKAFNNRKPLIVKLKDFKDTTTSKSPIETSTKPSTATASTTVKNDLSTNVPTVNEKLTGQKEIVLPRPATNSQANMFKGFGMFDNKNLQFKQQQYDPLHLMKPDVSNDTENIDKNNLKDDQKRNPKKDNIYDTIKQLLAMEQQLEKTPVASKVQKRFVTNEENLVNELNKLKSNST